MEDIEIILQKLIYLDNTTNKNLGGQNVWRRKVLTVVHYLVMQTQVRKGKEQPHGKYSVSTGTLAVSL